MLPECGKPLMDTPVMYTPGGAHGHNGHIQVCSSTRPAHAPSHRLRRTHDRIRARVPGCPQARRGTHDAGALSVRGAEHRELGQIVTLVPPLARGAPRPVRHTCTLVGAADEKYARSGDGGLAQIAP